MTADWNALRRPNDYSTLGEAKQWLQAQLSDGTRCPCCEQHAQEYVRKLNSGMVRSLIQMYRAGGITSYVDVTEVCIGGTREEGKLRWWGLVEEMPERRDDGGRAGWWRVTPAGERFVRRMTVLPSHVRVYNNQFQSFQGSPVDVQQCLGSRFDLQELMHGTP